MCKCSIFRANECISSHHRSLSFTQMNAYLAINEQQQVYDINRGRTCHEA